MSKLFSRLTSINSYLFPFFVGFAFMLSGIESYSYIGFLRKFILVDSRFFVFVAILSGILLIGQKLNFLNRLAFKINLIILPISISVYLAMQFLEAFKFPNYVFSTYHVQPSNFFYVVVLSLALFLVSRLITRKSYFKVVSLKFLVVTLLLAIFLDGATRVVDAAVFSDIYIFSHLTSSYDYKMTALDRWQNYYDYIKFVKENTPENASILVPPQMLPWNSTGNVGLDRYFLYPRKLTNGTYDKPIDSKDFDYVLIVWGEWTNANPSSYGWPKVPVKGEKIIYFDPGTLKTSERAGDYDPKSSMKYGVWGIIKVRK